MTQPCHTPRPTPFLMILLALFALILQGCGDGVRVLPQPDANPTGYYSSGSVQGGPVAVNDLQAMVNGNRIIMMSAANKLLYDGTIISINDDDSFTANFIVYTDGENPIIATVDGIITEGSSITGTLTGSGTFSLTYASTNNQVAAVDLSWLSPAAGSGFDEFGFTIGAITNGTGNLTHDETAVNTLFDTCKMNGTVTSVSGTRLYSVNVELTECFLFGNNGGPNVNGTYTGLATTRDDNGTSHVRLVYAVSNGTYTLAGEFADDG